MAGAAADGRIVWLVLRRGGWNEKETREEKWPRIAPQVFPLFSVW